MIRILTIGDMHLKIGNKMRDEAMLNEIYSHIQAVRPDLIVCLGDVLDRFANIRTEPLKMATDAFRRFQKFAPTVLLIGNHERIDNSVYLTDEHPFNAIKYWSESPHKFTVVDKPINMHIGNIQLSFVPYVPEGRLIEALDSIQDGNSWKKSSVCFSHSDIYGSEYSSSGLKNTTGDRWLPEYPLLINGHIHDYQELALNVINLGSPMMHATNESINKYLMEIKINDKKNINCRLIKMDSPIYWVKTIFYADIGTYEIPPLPQLSEAVITIRGTMSELQAMNKNKKIKQWKALGVRIKQDFIKDSDIKNKVSNINFGNKKIPFLLALKQAVGDDYTEIIEMIK